jgi:hypothetical protein
LPPENKTEVGDRHAVPAARSSKRLSVVQELTRAEAGVATAPAEQLPAKPSSRSGRRLLRRAAVVLGGPLLGAVAVVLLLVTQFHTAYLTNDDTVVASLINGDFTGKRTSSLIVVPALFGHFVRLGYAALPHLPWYGITLYTLQIIGWTTVVAIFFTLRRRPPVAERIVAAAAISLLAPWMILRVGYTSTALFLGGVGVVLFAVSAKVRGRLGTVYAVAGGMMLGTTYIMRANALLAIAAAFAPVFVVIGIKAGLRRTLLFGLVVATFVLAGWGSNRLEYSRPDWRNYMAMNSARGALHDTPRLNDKNVSNADLQRIGWTRNDLVLFRDFSFPDKTVYSRHAIETLAKLSPYVRDDTIGAGDVYNAFFRYGADKDLRADKGVVVAPVLLIAVMLALWRRRSPLWLTAASLVWFVAVLITILLFIRLPGRVMTPLEGTAVFMAVALPTYLSPRAPKARKGRSLSSIALIVIVALAVVGPMIDGVWGISHMSADTQQNIRAFKASYAWLEKLDPQGIFTGRADLFNSWGKPLSLHTEYRDSHFIPPGWSTNSPAFEARLDRVGIKDLYNALQTNPHMYLVGQTWKAAAVQAFYRQHRGINVRMILRGTLTYPYPIGKMGVWSVLPPTSP